MFNATVAICLLCATAGIERDVPKRVVQGEVCCRVLLIDFEDREHVHSREAFEKLFFGSQVNVTPGHFQKPMIGSARDWFGELSDGRLRLTGEVMPWVRSRLKIEELPHWRKTKDGNRDWWQPVVTDAMSLNNIPKDDRINGKRVDFYSIIYAGPISGHFKCLGKKTFMGAGMRHLPKGLFRKTKVPNWEDRWHGKKIIFSPERWREEPSDFYGVGLMFHEMGHAICHFGDLYGERNGNFGPWAVMGLGEKTHFPTGPTALHRYMAGWLAFDVPQQRGTHQIVLPPLQAKRAVKLVNGPMPWADALIVEHRVRLSPHQTKLPAEGLFVYEAYGRRRIRTVAWDKKTKKSRISEYRLRIVRADDTKKDTSGDVFRKGRLSLFGCPSSASSATGCGFWKLNKIHVPKRPKGKSSVGCLDDVARFEATYCPRHVVVRKPGVPIHLGRWLPQGDYRFYIQVAKGTCSVEGDNTLLQVTTRPGAKPQWGLVDVHVPADRRRLSLVPDADAELASAQVVERKAVTLNLLAEPYAQQLASGFEGKISTSTSLDKNVCVGGAISIPLGKSKPEKSSVCVTCPGGVLRLALRAFVPKKKKPPKMTLVIRNGDKRYKYLSGLQLDTNRPEFLLIDCNHLRGKSVKIEFALGGPEGGRVVLWEAGFVND